MAASREKVLYFEPQPSEQTAALKTVLVRMGVRIKNVEAVSAGQTVGFLLNRKGFEPTDATADAPSAPMMVLDGYQIRTLILTMIYRLCPTLIREGYVYIAETPLFEITCGEKTWFAYTDKEKNDIVKDLEGKRYKVDRSKGLGENDPEMMWLTTMNPETRRLIKVMPEEAEATARSFDLLLGDNLQGRKDHIAENGYKYLEMIDVS